MKKQMKEKKDERAKDQAKSQLEGIKEMIRALNEARDSADDFGHYDGAEVTMDDMIQRISEVPLSVEVRSGWVSGCYNNEMKPEEFKILLCWGGPAVQIVGDLDEHGQPENPRLEYQDWFTGWTKYEITEEEEKDVLIYCSQFYFGE